VILQKLFSALDNFSATKPKKLYYCILSPTKHRFKVSL